MQRPPGTVKVLYLVGWGRSGTTVLGSILGQLEGMFAVGELRNVWEHYPRGANRLCGCGAPLRECTVWSAVFEEAFGDAERLDASEMVRLRDSTTRTRHIPRMFAPGPLRSRSRGELRRLGSRLESLYRAVGAVTGAEIVVDTSKNPAYAALLDSLRGVELFAVHLVRDPRAVAYSWQRRKLTLDTAGPQELRRIPPAESALLWNVWNVAAEALGRRLGHRYLRLRYEDLIAAPRRHLVRIRDAIGSSSALPFRSEREVDLRPGHTVMGNPVRFRTGTVSLQDDDEWREGLSPRQHALVTSLTWPLLRRYGYR